MPERASTLESDPSVRPSGLRERNKHRRVQDILEATRELIRNDPGQTPTVEAIAARAQVAPATVFNLVGTREQIWAALVDQALAVLETRIATYSGLEPHRRARRITSATIEVLLADASVNRHVLSNWSQSGRLLRRDPTRELLACLEAARDAGTLRADLNLEAIADTISTACLGAVHQWAAGLIDERRLRRRCATAVDVAFAAAASRRAAQDEFLASVSL
jgi:AcrR family transcriptional regulator